MNKIEQINHNNYAIETSRPIEIIRVNILF